MTLAPVRRHLHDGWTVTAVGGPVPDAVAGRTVSASVPGSVHTDLMAAGLIPDPYLDGNERLLGWVGQSDWEYRTTFSWAPDGHGRHDLVFEGLDTAAVVTLNGRKIASTANQHRTYRLAVGDVLTEGPNELVVRFTGPVRYADAQSIALGPRPHVNHHPYNAIRKAACNFGWDWGVDAATAGIWRPVTLHSWSGVRLAQVRPVATVDGGVGQVAVHVELEWTDASRPVTLTAAVGGTSAGVVVQPGQSSTVLDVEVREAQLWWPRGYGEQPLYPVTVDVREGESATPDRADTWTGRVGFRSVRVEETPDEHGTPFAIIVNDQPVFIRGANWIPDDVFFHRVDRDRYAQRIAQAEQANVNLLRVWGGGIYEADDFYDLCDERGILTWQDFLFTCAAYAEEEPLRGEIEAEARDNITRLLPHPSLVLWNGNNENVLGYHHWGWKLELDGQSWGVGYYTELLPELLAELDPHRPYVPASPWSGSIEADPNDHDHGLSHLWGPWNQWPYTAYRNSVPRFAAEFGWQGPPTWPTLRRSISDEPLTPESPGMLIHQKAWQGNQKLTSGLVRHLPLPTDMDDWHWAMSLNQAVAIRVGLEHLRSWSPRCGGAVVWQLNDCWPVTSWAAVDGDGRPKPLLFAMAHAFADRLLTIQPRAGGLAVIAVNDSPSEWSDSLVIGRWSFKGVEQAGLSSDVTVPPRTSVTIDIAADVAEPSDVAGELLVATLGDERAEWFFAEYRDSALETPQLNAVAAYADGHYEVRVTAGNLVRDVSLLAERVHPDARVDDMLVTLLPGESTTFRVTAPEGLDPDSFTAPTVLRSANDLLGTG